MAQDLFQLKNLNKLNCNIENYVKKMQINILSAFNKEFNNKNFQT